MMEIKMQTAGPNADYYVTCPGEKGNRSGSDKFLMKQKSAVQAIYIQYNHSGHSHREAMESFQ